MEQFKIYHTDDITHVFAELENIEDTCNLFMKLAEENNCTIQKYYWVSNIDNTIIEYFKPKIFDVYTFHCDIYGKKQDIQRTLQQYKYQQDIVRKLAKLVYIPLQEFEIKQYGRRAFQCFLP